MAKFYVVIREVVEKAIKIEVDTNNKNEAEKIYKDKDSGDFKVISEETIDWVSDPEFRNIYTEKEYLG